MSRLGKLTRSWQAGTSLALTGPAALTAILVPLQVQQSRDFAFL